jgi:hypothetical protein
MNVRRPDGPEVVTKTGPTDVRHSNALNELIVKTVNEMPRGGTYATNAAAFAGLRAASSVETGRLIVRPEAAKPNFCSGATYLVFLSVLEKLQQGGELRMDPQILEKLQVRGQSDGAGVWGRWNANGPGTARLFYELKLGRNFSSYGEAMPGDFVKLFWNDGIGSTEKGHSAIFLGLEKDESGNEWVSYWSSNQSEGFGFKKKERSKIKRVLFSRLERPEALARLASLPQRDDYLASLIKRPSTPAEMYRMVGMAHQPADPSGSERAVEPIAPSAPGNAHARTAADPAVNGAPLEPAAPIASSAGAKKQEKSPPPSSPTPAPAAKRGFFQWLFSK